MWNCELKTRLSDIVSHRHIPLRNNYRQITTAKKFFYNVILKCFQKFATEEVKGVNYFPFRANDLEI